ncbi:MAG: hypothetical protein J7621_29335, partial [Niastella sp.]|nr:hypothetical protein [Niastella sp.]
IVHRELEGLEKDYIFGQLKREIAATFQSAANWFDRAFTWGTKNGVESETKTGNVTTTTSASTTTSTHTNFGQGMGYIIRNNTNEGYTGPILKTETKSEVTVTTKVEVKTPVATGSVSTTVNQDGTTTVTSNAKIKRNGFDVGVNVSRDSKGNDKAGASISTNLTPNTTVKAGATGTVNTNTGTGNVQLTIGIEQKVENKKITSSAFIKIGQ